MNKMDTKATIFNARELCSRKLWQLVTTESAEQVSETQLREAVEELAERRHHLAELQRLGKLGDQRQGA